MRREQSVSAGTAASAEPAAPVLEVDNLQTYFYTRAGLVKAVDGVSFALRRGETLAVVGESGCGKSVTALSLLRLVGEPGRIVGGAVRLEGRDLAALNDEAMRDVRGNQISMIFQEPMTSLNPVMTIGRQIREALKLHQNVSPGAAASRAVEMLHKVGIPEPQQRVNDYPHQLSGGMRQRAMIAMALACNPKVLIADEPTSALDVTIQAQILELIANLQRDLGTAVILITHDLGIVAENAHRVIVMYAGRKVEEAAVDALFAMPLHPYTRGLVSSIPRLALMRRAEAAGNGRLQEIPGMVPALSNLPQGCTFAPRCAFASDICRRDYPPYEEKQPGHWAACWHADQVAEAGHA
ncbi:MAG TPA: ABC transporter ATP-binding protein [Hyphomicrobiaceae bacterium]|nr:ABC transporter ATP-binding protein [Hyphomicrobiaceae bacterium]